MSEKLKNTKQREAILKALREAAAPKTAEEICEAVSSLYPRLALSTVYRNLERFTKAGLLEKNLFHDGVTRYALCSSRHGHYLICTACDQKIRISDCPLHRIESDLARDTGFSISGHDLTIYGLCPACKQQLLEEEKKEASRSKES